MSSDDFLFDENEWSFSPDIELMDEGVFLQKHEEMPINHTIYYNPYEIQEEIKSLNDYSFPLNESGSLFKDDHPSRDVEVKEKLSETDAYNARGTLPNTDEDVSRPLMKLHTNEVENSQKSQEGSLAGTIKELIMLFKSRQDAIDDNTYKVKGRGRKRNNPHLSTPDLEVLVLEYLRNCIEKYKDYTKGDGRKDTLFINFITAIKKVCYYLVTKCTPVNMYKRGKFSNYLAAFAEAESSFLFSVKHFDVERLVESFVEFISIYNPIDKVKTILHILREQREVSYKFLQVQQENLRNRNKKTIKSIRKWAQNSEIFKVLLLKTLEVMEEPKFNESKNIKHLKKTIKCVID